MSQLPEEADGVEARDEKGAKMRIGHNRRRFSLFYDLLIMHAPLVGRVLFIVNFRICFYFRE